MTNGPTLTCSNVTKSVEMDEIHDVQMDQDEEVNNFLVEPTTNTQAPSQWTGAMEDSAQAKMLEESTKKAVLLKRKELKWKLMQASQGQNRAKLQEIGTEVNYHRQKLSKAQDLVAKLRSKYLKVVRSAKTSELQLKKAEAQFSSREKFVADEKMQLTKLALDCIQLGKQLYGPSYHLPIISSSMTKTINMRGSAESSITTLTRSTDSRGDLLSKLSPFLRKARLNASDQNNSETVTNQSNMATAAALLKKRKRIYVTKLSSIYDCRDSRLRNLASFRLTSRFLQRGFKLTDLNYSHNISPHEYICLPDLIGECTDKCCLYQHKSNYIMTDLEKLADILSYKPSVAKFEPDSQLTSSENDKMCRLKLKQYAARLIARNPNRSAETLAQGLVKRIRLGEVDQTLLTSTRQLPKTSHLLPKPIECSCKQVMESTQQEELNSDKAKLQVSATLMPDYIVPENNSPSNKVD